MNKTMEKLTDAEKSFLDKIFSENHNITDADNDELVRIATRCGAEEVFNVFLKSPKHKRQREMLSKEELESLVFGDN